MLQVAATSQRRQDVLTCFSVDTYWEVSHDESATVEPMMTSRLPSVGWCQRSLSLSPTMTVRSRPALAEAEVLSGDRLRAA